MTRQPTPLAYNGEQTQYVVVAGFLIYRKLKDGTLELTKTTTSVNEAADYLVPATEPEPQPHH